MKKNNNKVWIAVIAVLVVVIAALIVVLVRRKPKDDVEKVTSEEAIQTETEATPETASDATEAATTEAQATQDCFVKVTNSNSWESANGYSGQLDSTITNKTSGALKNWEIRMTVPDKTTLDSSWNGTFKLDGTTLSVKCVDYNAEVPANGNLKDIGVIVTVPSQADLKASSTRTDTLFPYTALFRSLCVTGVIQSSSASVGILQALSATGVITYGSAIPIIMGQNIGTCVTALISSVGANKNARRAAMVHLYFNIIGVTIFLVGFYGLNTVCHFAFVNTTIEAWGIAVVHSVFNIVATLVLLPFANLLEKLAILTIPDSPEKESFALLDDRLLNTPAVAVERARSATAEMAELARVGVMQAMSLTHEWNDTLAQKVREEETQVDRYEDALGTYLVKLSSRELNHADSQSVNTLLHTISDFERISDHSVNLMESAEEMHTKEIQFSQDARDELQVLEDAVQDILNRTTDAFRKGDLHLASKVEPLEAVVNELVRAIKAHHIARLQAGSCSIEYGFVLDDLLTNYERVCDHCSNVAVAQIEVAQDSFDTHAYLNELRHGNDTKESEEFHRRLDRYRERYLFPENQSAEDFDK